MDEENNNHLQELQILEHNINSVLMQRQSIQLELGEVSTALEELEKTNDEVYRVLGSFMLKTNKESVKNELTERKKILDLRDLSLEKQEKLFLSKVEDLRNQIQKTDSK